MCTVKEPETLNIVVIGMGYVGIPCAALLADVPGFRVTGAQRRSPVAALRLEDRVVECWQEPFGR